MKTTEISLDINAVLKGQGADPSVIKDRNPGLLKIAQSALDIGLSLIKPNFFTKSLSIISLKDGEIILDGGIYINSKKIAKILQGADVVQAVTCTIGEQLEKRSSELFSSDASLALALDGLANAAVDQLVELICCDIQAEAEAERLKISMPVSPGSSEWPLEVGQPVLFEAIKPDPDIIQLSDSFLMIPKKSSSFIVGIGKDIVKHGKTCDYCSAREFCRYRIRKKF